LRFDQVVRGQNLGVIGESGLWSCQTRLGRVIHRLLSDCV
jgi:ABC-type oligopeptide transport system ATPase subunit